MGEPNTDSNNEGTELEPTHRTFQPPRFVLGLEDVDRAHMAAVGGKGMQLGELLRIEGIRVPAGFCVTTDAFRRIMAELPSIDGHLDQLARLDTQGSVPVSEIS